MTWSDFLEVYVKGALYAIVGMLILLVAYEVIIQPSGMIDLGAIAFAAVYYCVFYVAGNIVCVIPSAIFMRIVWHRPLHWIVYPIVGLLFGMASALLLWVPVDRLSLAYVIETLRLAIPALVAGMIQGGSIGKSLRERW